MNPLIHAKNSVKKFGGTEADYIEIHEFMDSAKPHIADIRHRIVLHNAFGVELAGKVFGHIEKNGEGKYVKLSYIVNSNGNKVFVRDIAQQHILDDLGKIPTLSQIFETITIEQLSSKLGVFNVLARQAKKMFGTKEIDSGSEKNK